MACNLPVVTTPFIGLLQTFAAGHGLVFVAPTDIMSAQVVALLHSWDICRTREMVQTFAWPAITRRLLTCYERLLTHETDLYYGHRRYGQEYPGA
jgi:glycosyltransferase involved in cell wall biosynthesis